MSGVERRRQRVKVAITGASGLLGTTLAASLREDGHEVLRLVRRPARAADEAQWDPSGGTVDLARLEGSDAVVHLAGEPVFAPFTRFSRSHREAVRASRVDGTTTVARALAALASPPRVLLSASGVGWYGDRGDEVLDERASSGDGFLAEVCRAWEDSADPARAAGVRVVHLRTGLVMTDRGGLVGFALPFFRLGLGGNLGPGTQYMPFISLHDEIAAMRFLLDGDDVAGPVNLTAPEPVTNTVWTAAVARAVHRPAVFTVPSPALKLALGGFADEGALVSQRAVPGVLMAAGFRFEHPDVDSACFAAVA